jgi:hypothetical protein
MAKYYQYNYFEETYMAKRNRAISSTVIERRIQEGRGQGHGKEYKPWLTIRDIGSHGFSTRIPGWTTGRLHHFLSELELNIYYLLDWSPNVVDIREQFPLPMAETLSISERLAIKHPAVPKTQETIPLTTDFLIDVNDNGKIINYARTVKYSNSGELENDRVAEKFDIERTYWTELGIDWGVITQEDVSETVLQNVKWVYPARILSEYPSLNPALLIRINDLFLELSLNKEKSLGQICDQIDEQLSLKIATSITACRHLIASRLWEVNIEELMDANKPLSIIKSTINSSSVEVIG